MQLMHAKSGSRRRDRMVTLAVLVAIPLLGFGGWKFYREARPRYLRWKQQRALTQARDFIEKRDAGNAQVALEVALTAVPGDPDTIRVAADMLEQVGAPQAMRLRRAVVQAVPNSADDVARLIVCCLRFGDYNAAKDALSGASPSLSAQTPMLQAAIAYAAATSDTVVVAALLQELRKRFPNDTDLKHAEAMLYLQHPDEKKRADTRARLERLAQEEERLKLAISRELASDAVRRKDYADARQRWRTVLQDPKAVFNDRLQLANIALLIDKEPLTTVMPPLAAAIRTDDEAVAFAQWLLAQGRGQEVDRWLNTLAPERQEVPALRAARIEAVALLKDWDRLLPLLEKGAWGPISRDVLKLVAAAQAVDDPKHLSLRRETWEMALGKAQANLATLRVLQRLALTWGWQDEAERTLWTVARGYPDQTWAHQALFNYYREKQRTTEMRDVMRQLRDSDVTVLRYQHDWALLSLLTEPNATWSSAKETMRKLHETDPANATFAVGYAFALAQAERGAEALQVVERLSASERDYPPRQPYLAFIYGVARQPEGVAHAQEIGANLNFLPEETFLFSRARIELGRKPDAPKPATTKPGRS